MLPGQPGTALCSLRGAVGIPPDQEALVVTLDICRAPGGPREGTGGGGRGRPCAGGLVGSAWGGISRPWGSGLGTPYTSRTRPWAALLAPSAQRLRPATAHPVPVRPHACPVGWRSRRAGKVPIPLPAAASGSEPHAAPGPRAAAGASAALQCVLTVTLLV